MILNKVFFTFLIITIIYVYPTYSVPLTHKENLKLELVQVIFRHGARSPTECEAKFMRINETFFRPWGFAQLTKEGMRQEYEIGQMLRERYNGFLPPLYNQKHVYAYSSDTARTKASLSLVLSALYPPVDEFAWNPKLNWMPIPIHSNPRQLDILTQPRSCPKFKSLIKQLYNSTEWKTKASVHDEARETLKRNYGRESTIKDVFCAYSSMKVLKNFNLPLPDWYRDEEVKKFHATSVFYLNSLSYDAELKRINGGTYVRRFVENMNDANVWKGRKIYLYSAHESTLHPVASFHNLTFPSGVPEYGSAIVIEKLRNQNNQQFVKILAWIGSPKKLEVLKLEKCAELCPMEKYLSIVSPVLPSDDDMLCLFKAIDPKSLETILNTDTGALVV